MSHGATAGISQGAALIEGVYETSATPCPWEAFDLALLVFSRTSVFLVLVLIGAETQYAELLATCNYTGILTEHCVPDTAEAVDTRLLFSSSQPCKMDTPVTPPVAEWRICLGSHKD